jgi:hypothetical protein
MTEADIDALARGNARVWWNDPKGFQFDYEAMHDFAHEIERRTLEAAAQLCEAHIREYRGRAEDGDYFEALPGKIRGL